jgi:hypothetical protein
VPGQLGVVAVQPRLHELAQAAFDRWLVEALR